EKGEGEPIHADGKQGDQADDRRQRRARVDAPFGRVDERYPHELEEQDDEQEGEARKPPRRILLARLRWRLGFPHSERCFVPVPVGPGGQPPASPVHTMERGGAPFCRRSGTLAPKGPGTVSARQSKHAAFIASLVGGSWRSTHAASCWSAGVNASAFRQCSPLRVTNC